ncbi:hypothetical protein [Kineococcus esterisolvens]|uniref:hypothetical protein n=1 Tax=unclassified Kineococcus TaxID=2621656 RepID=UPI003D7EE815
MTTNRTATRKSSRSSASLHRRMLAAGLIAGVSSVGLTVATASTASAAAPVSTVESGLRTPVTVPVAAASPAALPAQPGGAGAQRGTYVVTVSL